MLWWVLKTKLSTLNFANRSIESKESKILKWESNFRCVMHLFRKNGGGSLELWVVSASTKEKERLRKLVCVTSQTHGHWLRWWNLGWNCHDEKINGSKKEIDCQLIKVNLLKDNSKKQKMNNSKNPLDWVNANQFFWIPPRSNNCPPSYKIQKRRRNIDFLLYID